MGGDEDMKKVSPIMQCSIVSCSMSPSCSKVVTQLITRSLHPPDELGSNTVTGHFN